MKNEYYSGSRRSTPWDLSKDPGATAKFIRETYHEDYARKHQKLIDTDESALINEYDSSVCPLCGSTHTKKCGFTDNGIQNHWCYNCHHHFTPLTGTIHQDHKISLTEWIEYWRNLFQYLSFNASSWNSKTAITTSKYWFKKTCLLLEDYQKSIVLKKKIWYDVTSISEQPEDIVRHANGKKLRGNSINQINIGATTDTEHTVLFVLGNGHPTQAKVYEAFKDHIEPGSILVTDQDRDHRLLVRKLNLVSKEYDAKKIKELPDSENPMNEINRVHNRLQKFFRAHSGFARDSIGDYLNLFAFIENPPQGKLEKIQILLDLSLKTKKSLKYRDLYAVFTPDSDD